MFSSNMLFTSQASGVFEKRDPGHFIYVDTDETIRVGGKPNNLLIGYLRRLRQLHPDYTIVLWSRAGQEHAKEVATELDLLDIFDYILAKPTWLFDDAGKRWGRNIEIIAPDGEIMDKISSINEYIGDHSNNKKPTLFG